jgi:hypothetical protein
MLQLIELDLAKERLKILENCNCEEYNELKMKLIKQLLN